MRGWKGLLCALLSSTVAMGAPLVESEEMDALERRAWNANQKSETMCNWYEGQSAVLRDKLLIDGGTMEFARTLENGAAAGIDMDDRNVMYVMDLTKPFRLNINISHAFEPLNKDAVAVRTMYGSLLVDDHKVVSYGGAMLDAVGVEYPDRDHASKYTMFAAESGAFSGPRWDFARLNNGVTRYVTRGSSVSAPSEKLGFYMFGLRNKNRTWEEVRDSRRPPFQATELSNVFITADMSLSAIKWSNRTIDRKVPLRYDPASVWLPIGKKGSIFTMGGSINGLDRDDPVRSSNTEEIEKIHESAIGLTRNLVIYDIDSDKWHIQETTGILPEPVQGHCAVGVTSDDGKSHHIYIYGGWRSWSNSASDYDSVHVLSIPSFHWTKVHDGERMHARHQHKCHRVAANKLMVVGGRTSTSSGTCMANFVRVFNMNTLEWEDKYDPGEKEDKFIVPKIVAEGAERNSVDVDDDVKDLLDTPYAGKLPNPFPYPRGAEIDADITVKPNPDGSDKDDNDGKEDGGSKGTPSYIAPLLGVLLGLFGLAVILCIILFIIRRKKRARNADGHTEASSARRNKQTWTWLLGTNEKNNPQYYNQSQEDIDYTAAPLDEHRGFFAPQDGHQTPSDMHSVLASPATTAQRVQSGHTVIGTPYTELEGDHHHASELEDSKASPAAYELPAHPLDMPALSEAPGDNRHPQSPVLDSPIGPVGGSSAPLGKTPGAESSEAEDYMSIGALEKEMGGMGPFVPPKDR